MKLTHNSKQVIHLTLIILINKHTYQFSMKKNIKNVWEHLNFVCIMTIIYKIPPNFYRVHSKYLEQIWIIPKNIHETPWETSDENLSEPRHLTENPPQIMTGVNKWQSIWVKSFFTQANIYVYIQKKNYDNQSERFPCIPFTLYIYRHMLAWARIPPQITWLSPDSAIGTIFHKRKKQMED